MAGRRRTLTASFAVVSIAAMSALGVALVVTQSQFMRQQALDDAVRTAVAYVKTGVNDRVPLKEWTSEQLSPASQKVLTANLRTDADLREVRVFATSGRPLYDSAGSSQSYAFPDTDRLDLALGAGTPTAEIVTQVESGTSAEGRSATTVSDAETVLDVYVPVRAKGSGAPVAVAQVVLDYSSNWAATSAALQRVALLVAGCLVAVWLLLFRTVRRASRVLRASASENARLALLDPLTGLPNRRLLSQRLEVASEQATMNRTQLGLLIIDVDQFKEINDSLGHDRGDQLLQQVANRLSGIVRSTDTVARLGGDEFAILLSSVRSIDDGVMFGQRVLEQFAEPFHMDGLVLHVETSVGLAVLPDHADDITTLLKHADIAMYVAKAGRIGLSVYDPGGDSSSTAKLILLGDLRQALSSDDQLSMHYQPKIDLESGDIVGLEALLRWNHPTRGNIPPAEFVPLAERTGLVHSLTRKVLELVLSQMREWRQSGWEVQVGVNLSALNLSEPDLDHKIAALLAEYDVPAELLEFEITESAIVQDPERAAITLRKIAAMGSTIALDDFGIGNTSISQLRDLPVDTLKIDRSFIVDLENGNEVLVRVVTDLAHEFQMVAVAEGVEARATADHLKRLGCDLAQGFLYARPMPADELLEHYAEHGMRPRDDASELTASSTS
ncbi:MAG: EAL domain-containing protein [Candidatus Nanopelagicales bacterium]